MIESLYQYLVKVIYVYEWEGINVIFGIVLIIKN